MYVLRGSLDPLRQPFRCFGRRDPHRAATNAIGAEVLSAVPGFQPECPLTLASLPVPAGDQADQLVTLREDPTRIVPQQLAQLLGGGVIGPVTPFFGRLGRGQISRLSGNFRQTLT